MSPPNSKQLGSQPSKVQRQMLLRMAIAASVVLLFIMYDLLPQYLIMFSDLFSPVTMTRVARVKETESFNRSSTFMALESCGAFSTNENDNDADNNATTTTTSLLNMTALEYIMKSPLGCEFSYVGGREHVLEQLRNKHILFIGDSVLRYQYRALLYALHFGHTDIKGPGNETHPSEVWEGDFHTFSRFYQQLQMDLTEQYFQCDCFRRSDTMAGFYENMYYFEPEYNLNLTFFFHADWVVGGHRPLRWKPEYKSELDIYVEQGINATTPLVPPDFMSISVPELVNMVLEDVGTFDELVVSLGDHWGVGGVGNTGSQWTWEEYARPLELLVQAPKTPTYALSTRTHLRAPLTTLATEDNWTLFNRTAIIEPLVELFQKQEWPMNLLYTDALHFWGWAYDRLNEELLQLLLGFK